MVILKSFKCYLQEVKKIVSPQKYKRINEIESSLFFDNAKNFTQWLKDKGLQGYPMTLRIKDEQ